MPSIQTGNKFLTAELSALSSAELDKIISQAIVLRAKKNAPSVSENEADLLLKINQGLSASKQKRFEVLAEKLHAETISESERQEFLRLTGQIEKTDAKRIKLIGDLAVVRNRTFDEILRELGIAQS
jgi:hypothetical protein